MERDALIVGLGLSLILIIVAVTLYFRSGLF